MKRRELLIDQGGLMRCCLESALHWVEAAPNGEATNGETIECESEHVVTMRVVGNLVRWIEIDFDGRLS